MTGPVGRRGARRRLPQDGGEGRACGPGRGGVRRPPLPAALLPFPQHQPPQIPTPTPPSLPFSLRSASAGTCREGERVIPIEWHRKISRRHATRGKGKENLKKVTFLNVGTGFWMQYLYLPLRA